MSWRLWRNNSGVLPDRNGRPVRYGLANDSAALNARIKSSDLIGLDDAGRFVAIECKAEGWKLTPGDERGQAQWRFIQLVQANGGRAGFVTDPKQLETL